MRGAATLCRRVATSDQKRAGAAPPARFVPRLPETVPAKGTPRASDHRTPPKDPHPLDRRRRGRRRGGGRRPPRPLARRRPGRGHHGHRLQHRVAGVGRRERRRRNDDPGARRHLLADEDPEVHGERHGSARITLTAYGSEKVRIDGSELAAGSWLAGIHGDYWTVQGLTFQNSPAQGFVATSSVGGIFKNLVTANNGDSGFTLRGDGTTNNLVQNLDSHGNYDAAGHGQNADGIAVKFGSGTGNRITGARLYNNSDDGLDLWQFSSPVTIEHSWAFGNGKNRWSDSAFEGNGNGFKLGGGGVSVAHSVNNNAAWDNTSHGFTENSNTGADHC